MIMCVCVTSYFTLLEQFHDSIAIKPRKHHEYEQIFSVVFFLFFSRFACKWKTVEISQQKINLKQWTYLSRSWYVCKNKTYVECTSRIVYASVETVCIVFQLEFVCRQFVLNLDDDDWIVKEIGFEDAVRCNWQHTLTIVF